ncbi:MAG: class I SAM-dependent methyltransferase [Saccharospirillum sp.]
MATLASLSLSRIPPSPALQAWNAADELAIERLGASTDPSDLLLVNDAFGALSLALGTAQTDWWSDSAMAHSALAYNADANRKPLPRLIADARELRSDYRRILMQVPKSLDLFRWQLQTLGQRLSEGGELFALGMVKHLSTSHQRCMSDYFERCEPGLAVKKARCVRLTGPRPRTTIQSVKKVSTPSGLHLLHEPGCFSSNRLDPGARVLLSLIARWPSVDHLLDLGCGNGVLALSYLQQQTNARATLVDESLQAVHSAERSARVNGLEDRVQCLHHHGIAGLDLPPVPLILCNPPFHQANTLTEDIALHLSREARQSLCATGEFWVVANRHLPYFAPLKRLFSQVERPSRHPKFIVYRCRP